jgi:hypothetical protein
VEGRYCLSPRDKIGDDHSWFSAKFMEMSLCRVGFVASFGASGEILLMWDGRAVLKVDVCQGNFVAACSFRNVDDCMEWAFAGVYGPNRDAHRRQMWEELAGLMCIWEMP